MSREQQIANARIAAAARNASVAKSRESQPPSRPTSGTGPARPAEVPSRPSAAATTDPEDTLTHAVVPGAKPDEPSAAAADPPPAAPGAYRDGAQRPRGLMDRVRGGRRQEPAAAPAPVPAAQPLDGGSSANAGATTTAPQPGAPNPPQPAPVSATQADGEPGKDEVKPTGTADTVESFAERNAHLSWRERLGFVPRAKAAPVEVPPVGPGAATAVAAAAATLPTASPDPAARTGSPAPANPTERPVSYRTPVTPASPVNPSNGPDTAVIPAVGAGASAASAGPQALAAAKPKVGARPTRKARLRLSQLDPWSVMKTAFLFSIAAGIMFVVASYAVWAVLNASGLFASVNDVVKSVVSTPGDTTPFRVEEYINTQKVMGVAALIAVVDVLIFTALATLGSFLYNLAATVLGGLEVTLAED